MKLKLKPLFIVIVSCTLLHDSAESPHEARLLDELLNNRGNNPLVRPVMNEEDAVELLHGIALRQIVKVDEVNEALYINMWQQMHWYDVNLSWNASEYGGIMSLGLPPSLVWKPDLIVNNRIQYGDKTEEEGYITIHSDGRCFWAPMGISASHCSINIKWFPFDSQLCFLNFESWNFIETKLNLTLKRKKVSLKHFKSNSQWELIETWAERSTVEYDSGNYNMLQYGFHLRRKVLFYGFNLIMPCILISMLAVVAFYLPAESGERIGLSVSILLALSVYQLIVLERIPASGDHVPLLGVYFGSVTILCIVIIIMTIIVVNLQHRSPPMYSMPNWVNLWICERLARLLRVQKEVPDKRDNLERKFNQQIVKNGSDSLLIPLKQSQISSHVSDPILEHIKTLARLKENKELEKEKADQWKFSALVIDRLCFLLFSIYWIVGTSGIFVAAWLS